MKFFIDTANFDEIKEAYAWGILDGVTTNPSLVAKEPGIDFHQRLKEIAELVNGSVSGEVISLDSEGMIKEGLELSKLHKNITIKLPMTEEGLKACKYFSEKGIKTNVTLIFSAPQALLAARAGATYVSPFIGRLDDIGQDGNKLIEEINTIFKIHNINSEIIAASIRHPKHVLESALSGANIATVPFKVLKQMFKHPLTDKGIDAFINDWENKK